MQRICDSWVFWLFEFSLLHFPYSDFGWLDCDSLLEMAWNLVSRVLRLFISYPQSFSVKGSRLLLNLNSEGSFEIWNFRFLCSVPTAGLTGGKTAVGPRTPVWPVGQLRSDRPASHCLLWTSFAGLTGRPTAVRPADCFLVLFSVTCLSKVSLFLRGRFLYWRIDIHPPSVAISVLQLVVLCCWEEFIGLYWILKENLWSSE